jgi:hypothetical protein
VLWTDYDRYMHWSLFEPVTTGYDQFFVVFITSGSTGLYHVKPLRPIVYDDGNRP